MDIPSNLKKIKDEIPEDVLVVAVSKTKPIKYIESALKTGHLHFGENKVQELVLKHGKLTKEIKWHMIGHLQRNKVKYIASFIYLIHSVDSIKLLKEIDKQANINNRIINVLIQVDISDDSTKFGFSFDKINELMFTNKFNEFKNVSVKGFMGMASYTDDKELITNQFKSLQHFFKKFKDSHSLHYLSMGMSSDYIEAINCDSNIIRLGTNIFGNRN